MSPFASLPAQPVPVRTLVTGGAGFIGSNLVEMLLRSGREVVFVGLNKSRVKCRAKMFRRVDVLDILKLRELFSEFKPDEVIHLAARTNFLDRPDPAGYRVNTQGTRNLIQTIAENESVGRCIFASSNVVFRDGRHPTTGREYQPAYLYGESKALAERIVKEDTSMHCTWCIVRPCHVWGPGFGTPYREFFLAVDRGLYVHLGNADTPKLLGYVGNAVYQILRLLEAPASKIHGRTFYLADDSPTTIRRWAEEIAGQLGAPRPFSIPYPLAKLGACAGDLLASIGWRNVPVTSRRLANMGMDNTKIPIDATREIAGPTPYSLGRGVQQTIAWLRQEGYLR